MSRVSKTLNYSNLKHNLETLEAMLQSKSRITAVVKADAYGHGIKEITTALSLMGIDDFAVATLEEALTVREINKTARILILGIVDIDKISVIKNNNLTLSLLSYDYTKLVEAQKISVNAELKLNTGMNRNGYHYDDYTVIKESFNLKYISIKGIYSHLSSSDSRELEDIEYTNMQIENYDSILSRLSYDNIDFGRTHLQASYGLINYPHLNYDTVRIGILMYGVFSNDIIEDIDIKPVLSLKTQVSNIIEVEANQRISYGDSFLSSKPMKLATISIGYADGLSRNLSNIKDVVSIHNTKCSIVGKVCMDQCVVDVSHLDNIKLFDDVILFDESHRIEYVSKKLNTISNDLLTSFHTR